MKPRRHLFRAPAIFGSPLKYGVPVFIGFTFAISGLTANAGDILRGGSPATNKPGRNGSGAPTPAATDAARANAKDTLARTTRTLAAMRDLQNAARNAAIRNGANNLGKNPGKSTVTLPKVPNGIALGGLKPTADPTKWTGADAPVQTVKNGKTKVTIKQTTQQALLNWDSFNVGRKTTLTFDQSKGGADVGKWIAFNKISDASGSPTQILGKIKAAGQVYLINSNGIIFGSGSQVNTHALVASALPINDYLVERGLLNNPDQQFLFSALPQSAGNDGTPAFDPGLALGTKVGDVIVQAGAKLTAPSSAAKVGGRIALIGANVFNGGTISTPDGQTILAAGLQVGFDAHSTSDPSLRGLDTYIGAVVDPASTDSPYAGTATNSGIIESTRASVTIAGKNVNQLGAITGTTSVSLNGRIDLLANYDAIGNIAYQADKDNGPAFLNRSTGTVELGNGSITQILPELDSDEKIIGTTLALPSQINLSGKFIHLDDNATIFAPNANVTANAGVWLTIPGFNATSAPVYRFVREGGRIDLDQGAVIDVSGSDHVISSVASNIIDVQLRGAELADSPLLRDGPLRGQTISVDITKTGIYNGKTWVGTSLADVSGYANLVQRTVGELTAAGGTVKLNAGEAVVIRKGATVDVSGGSIDYKGGVVKTTRVVAGGVIFDIAVATPDQVYDGIYGGSTTVSQTKWGTSDTYHQTLAPNGTRYQEGYTQGGNGGSLKISAGAMALDGKLVGKTFTGSRQREIGPRVASLELSFTSEQIVSGVPIVVTPVPPTITFSNSGKATAVADYSTDSNGVPLALPEDRISNVFISPDIVGKNGFGALSVYNPDGDIIVPEKVTLETVPRGSITLGGANLVIDGSIISPDGAVALNTYNLSPSVPASATELPTPNADRGKLSLGSHAVLSTAGLIVDDRPESGSALQTPNVIAGGTISINAFSADLSEGSVIDVSGGVNVTGGGKVNYGNAGAISILTGRDFNIKSVVGGGLHLGSTLKGFSGAKGGSLSLEALTVQIGGTAPVDGTLFLESSFFNQGGFSSFAISGIGKQSADSSVPTPGLVVKAGTKITPVVQSWLVHGLGPEGKISLGSIVKPKGLRSPVSLTLASTGLRSDIGSLLLVRGDLVVEEGATVDAGAAGSITLKGDTVSVQGSLIAHGGAIQISGASKLPLAGSTATTASSTVWLSSSATLDASGITLLTPDAFGRRRGAVLDGGSVTVSGNIVAESGALIDVSGTSGKLDLLAGESGKSLSDLLAGADGTTRAPYGASGSRTLIESNGGRIKLSGGEMLLTDASLKGFSGGKSASGGTLQISSGRFYPDGAISNPFDPTLVVTGSGTVIPKGSVGGIAVGMSADDSGVMGGGRFSTDDFGRGGFANLDLGGVIKFSGPVSVHADGRITAGSGPAIYADSAVNLDASYIVAGVAFQAPLKPGEPGYHLTDGEGKAVTLAPSYGTGTFTASAGLIDVGYLSLQGIGQVDLVAAGGDIRGNGTLEVAGGIKLEAGQIYPPTASNFTIAAFDYIKDGVAMDGSVTITVSGTRDLPLSAGGSLSIYASEINQNGVLRAPFGQITLGWDGTGEAPKGLLSGLTFDTTKNLTLGAKSITSVSAIDPVTGKGITIPYGLSLDGNTWLDPHGVDITSGGVPQKSVKLSGESVTTEEGSTVDIRGGGDLFAYRFVGGQGGTKDILADSGTFAVIPSYSSDFAPYAPFNSSSTGGDAGYVNGSLQVGQQIRLAGSKGLPAGVYTLLPARYALLPGAFLVTPLSGTPVGTVGKPDGSTIVSGSRFDGLESGLSPSAVVTRFEIASAAIIKQRAEFKSLLANTFLEVSGGLRLPGDAGQLVLGATKGLSVGGEVLSAGAPKFRAGLIDVSSPVDIYITGSGAAPQAGSLSIDASLLSSFGAESILIGGIRTTTSEGTEITVTTDNLTVDNSGSPLTGSEILLVAKKRLDISKDAVISRSGVGTSGSGNLLIGDADIAGSGNGALFRMGSDENVSVVRQSFTPGAAGALSVGENAILRGDSLILDSTSVTKVAASSVLDASALSLSSGKVTLVLDPGVTTGADAGLVLSGDTLTSLSTAGSLALSSYSSLDLLGSGVVGSLGKDGRPNIESLTLRAAEFRGLSNSGGDVKFIAKTINLDNLPGGTAGTTALAPSGSLTFQGENILLGQGTLSIKGFNNTRFDASQSIQTIGDGGLKVAGNLTIATPLVYSTLPAAYRIEATGDLAASGGGSSTGSISSAGLGSSLTLVGDSVEVDTRFYLPSGQISMQALSGDLVVGGSVETGGVERKFKDVSRYTDGGTISLASAHGNIRLTSGGTLDVSARPQGGDAGLVQLSAPEGSVVLSGNLIGSGGKGGKSGSISLDIGHLASLGAIDSFLNDADFNQGRTYRIRNGNVNIDGTAHAHSYHLSADNGSINLTGRIDASGTTGGSVVLIADENLTLAPGSSIDASGNTFDTAGKGGSVVLETRGENSGLIQMDGNSTIDLRVDDETADSAAAGQFTGTLHLRAPRIDSDLAIGTIDSTIFGASNVIVEGYQIYDLTGTSGAITTGLKNTIKSDATAFIGDDTVAQTREDRLLVNQGGAGGALGSILTVRPGAEIINSTGNITVGGATTSGATGDWNLASFRFGAEQVPGILTLRASGNLVFLNSLSDGFNTGAYNSALLARNDSLPDNAQGWSFRLTAGADFSAADTMTVKNADRLDSTTGSLLLGKNGFATVITGGNNALTSTRLSNTSATGLFQVIRTGSGDIDIAAGRDIRLLNQFATIYTAGTLVQDPTLGGTFATPTPSLTSNSTGSLGAVQQPVPAPVQYTSGGGNVTLSAGNDIIHLTQDAQGNLIADSERQMPNNWLYRRGYVDPVTGQFGLSKYEEVASTTWWVDFTNFFEGVGALGGGNVSLSAGRDVSNVDALAPTNGRMPGGLPDAASLTELGGGNVLVSAGRNIDGGVYYVERGQGLLSAGGEITTNSTRSPSLTILANPSKVLDTSLWLPTTLFLGKGTFDVKSSGDLLLGPVVNPFLLPTGFNNTFWYKSYFSTYAADSGVDISSLGGDITLRQSVSYIPGSTNPASTSVLQRWFTSELLLKNDSAAFFQPWLRLSESDVSAFSTAFTLLPPSVKATAISGNLSLQGDFNLSPSAKGTVEMLAGGSINGFNVSGFGNSGSQLISVWIDSRINLSDADPLNISGIANPFAYQTVSGTNTVLSRTTLSGFLGALDKLFLETGSSDGVLQEKQALHSSGLLHAGDHSPALLYAEDGDIDGLTMFSAKSARILAGQDIRDISFYLQNNSASDISVVSAGRDLIAYDSGTASQVASRIDGNMVALGDGPAAGDIQIAGPGALQVFAGREIDLGIGGNNANGTGTGITSIGNGRNPYLPFKGADVTVGAGIGAAWSLSTSSADFPAFIDKFVTKGDGPDLLKELGLNISKFEKLNSESQREVALKVFYMVLRDAGRNHNDPKSPGYGNYRAGKKAVATLFPETKGEITWDGDINTRARDIRTKNGGDITLFAPGGGLSLAASAIGNPLAPPGIITESGGDINVFTDKDVNLGISRIFTLRGGDEIIWSTHGDIAAGSSSKTVQSAPPTRVLIDPQSADVKTDLAGLATGGGIGVLSTVAGVKPSDVDLIAPEGTIDAGDAGIRVSGNLNIAAAVVVNAGNISVGGSSAGSSAPAASAPSVGSIAAASTTSAASTAAVEDVAKRDTAPPPPAAEEGPSLITVDVIGYGEGDAEEDEEKKNSQG
jgi:filamentous hemagglutinin